MAAKGQMTGMLGVYLTAAELTYRDLIVSVTSRNAKGADLIAMDQAYRKSWAIQVKTNRKAAKFWLLNKGYKTEFSNQLVYVFVNLRGEQRPDYYVVPSSVVAKRGLTNTSTTGAVWYFFDITKSEAKPFHEAWDIFNTGAQPPRLIQRLRRARNP
jgi:hypothetical protein